MGVMSQKRDCSNKQPDGDFFLLYISVIYMMVISLNLTNNSLVLVLIGSLF